MMTLRSSRASPAASQQAPQAPWRRRRTRAGPARRLPRAAATPRPAAGRAGSAAVSFLRSEAGALFPVSFARFESLPRSSLRGRRCPSAGKRLVRGPGAQAPRPGPGPPLAGRPAARCPPREGCAGEGTARGVAERRLPSGGTAEQPAHLRPGRRGPAGCETSAAMSGVVLHRAAVAGRRKQAFLVFFFLRP